MSVALHCNIGELPTELLLDDILEVCILLLRQRVLQQRQEEFRELLGILQIKERASV